MKNNNFENLIRNTKTLDLKGLKEESDKLFDEKKAKEDSLINAYNDKKLKSKSLIKEAQGLIKTNKPKEKKKD